MHVPNNRFYGISAIVVEQDIGRGLGGGDWEEGIGRRGLGEKWKEECRQQLENFVFAKEIDALRY